MTTHRTEYHVRPNATGDFWLVIQEHGGYREQFNGKDDAVRHALQLAQEQEPSDVKVYTHDGRLDCERSYGPAAGHI